MVMIDNHVSNAECCCNDTDNSGLLPFTIRSC